MGWVVVDADLSVVLTMELYSNRGCVVVSLPESVLESGNKTGEACRVGGND